MKIDAVILACNAQNKIYKKASTSLNSKALVDYTVEAALNAKCLRKIFLFADDKYTYEKYKSNKRVRILTVPRKLAEDSENKKKMMLHLMKKAKLDCELLAVLSFSFPLRTGKHIDEAIRFAETLTSFDSLASVTVARESVRKGIAMASDGKIRSLKRSSRTHLLNGALFILKPKRISKLNRSLISNNSFGFLMQEFDAFSVDVPHDVIVAEALLKFKEERISSVRRGGYNVERMYVHDDPEMKIRKNIYDRASYERHFKRYKFFLKHIEPSDAVLDIACGSGYGSEILASKAKFVNGVDKDKKTIKYARRHHLRSNIKFEASPIEAFNPATKYDKIISVETIEHIKKPDAFLKHAKKWLKPKGILWVTCPLAGKDRKSTDNPFHISEMDYEELRELMGRHFNNVSFYNLHGQGIFSVDTLNNKTRYTVVRAGL